MRAGVQFQASVTMTLCWMSQVLTSEREAAVVCGLSDSLQAVTSPGCLFVMNTSFTPFSASSAT